jgi:hydroxyacylglutathione hydrolase
MKKIVKRVLIGLGIFILIIALIGLGFYIKIRSETKSMNPAGTGKIVDEIYAIKDSYVNMFIIKDSNQYIAIDAGNDAEVVAGELKKLDIDPDQVSAVLLTHTDRDHVGALKIFKNARIYFSDQEVKMINGEKSKFLFFGNSISAKEYTLIKDQQVLNFNKIKIQGILVPGHTSGSMCYLADDKYLFTGDVITLKSGKIGKSIKFFDMDHEMASGSIAKITKLPAALYLFTAHCGYTNDYQNAVKDWKE